MDFGLNDARGELQSEIDSRGACVGIVHGGGQRGAC